MPSKVKLCNMAHHLKGELVASRGISARAITRIVIEIWSPGKKKMRIHQLEHKR
jgi:hypothetical protein